MPATDRSEAIPARERVYKIPAMPPNACTSRRYSADEMRRVDFRQCVELARQRLLNEPYRRPNAGDCASGQLRHDPVSPRRRCGGR
jgi:hypothetical protein